MSRTHESSSGMLVRADRSSHAVYTHITPDVKSPADSILHLERDRAVTINARSGVRKSQKICTPQEMSK